MGSMSWERTNTDYPNKTAQKKVSKSLSSFVRRKSRRGLGLGLFTKHDIRSGEFVVEYTGSRIPTKHADTLKTRYLFEVDEDWTVDGSSRTNLARYINHSCNPNCEAEIHNGRIYICAVRNIKAGEELSIDYGEEYFDEFIRPSGCKCERCAVRDLTVDR
jgi:hypothetical protein